MDTIFRKNDGNVINDTQTVNDLAGKLPLSKKALEILVSRGYRDLPSIERFLKGGSDRLNDPFLLNGMQELTGRVKAALADSETIVVYGDYDADGICSTAILTDYLVSLGANVVPYIPSRHNEGYGLSIEALERIIEEFLPGLILTCDCGVSACEEVQYVLDLGVDIIVTDHHEVPEACPECIVVNPKLKGQDYPFDALCGAGVALKVVQAMGGLEAAAKYYDLCALATVADLVPLVDENRAIVKLGLQKINSKSVNKGLRGLLDFIGYNEEVTASDLAFKVAPKINAAGRMGDAFRAFSLLTEQDPKVIFDLIKEISLDNDRRKEICENVYNEAIGDIAHEDLINNYSIILSHPSWERGLTSIVAAQLAGEYKRPTFLMVEVGDNYKGTARSVDGVNLYELLAAASDLLLEFGGHNQAAGFSLAKENLPLFKARINDFIRDNYSPGYFLPYADYDAEADESELTMALAKELECLEPFGLGNQRPIFKVSGTRLKAQCMKNKCQHLIAQTAKGLRLTCFGYGDYLHTFNSSADFDLALMVSVNHYRGKEYLSLTLRNIDFARYNTSDTEDKPAAEWLIAYCKGLLKGKQQADKPYQNIGWDGLNKVIDNSRIYGTLIITYDFASYDRLIADNLINGNYVHNYITPTTGNNYNRVFLGAENPQKLNNYDCVIFLETPPSAYMAAQFNKNQNTKVYAVTDNNIGGRIFDSADTSRESFVKAYTYISGFKGAADNIYHYYSQAVSDGGLTLINFVLCLLVFEELGIIKVSKECFNVEICPDIKVELGNSIILNSINDYKSEAGQHG